jgi:cystathionine beta-lyase
MEKTEFLKKYQVERLHTNSTKWDALAERFGDPDLLPLWVADMEFKVPEAVQQALIERINHGAFGYIEDFPDYVEVFNKWQAAHHHLTIQNDWLRFSTGVVHSLYNLVQIFSKEGDAVLIQPPVYYPFFDLVKDTNRQLVLSPLLNTTAGYTIDLADFEAKIIENKVKIYVLCSPHNPVGRVWTEQELNAVLEICAKHDVFVIADEIHQDFVLDGHTFYSTLNIKNGAYRNRLAICNAPSKTFNLASLNNSHVIIADDDVRKQYDEGLKHIESSERNLLGRIAARAAYAEGADWFDGLKQVVTDNYHYVRDQFAAKAPQVKVADLQGTYLLWIDLSAVVSETELKDFVQGKCRLAVDFGHWFSPSPAYATHIRLNLATIPENVETAVERLITEINKLNHK